MRREDGEGWRDAGSEGRSVLAKSLDGGKRWSEYGCVI